MALPLLHDYALSSACYRVRIGLNLKQLAYARVNVDLRTDAHLDPDYKAVNPQAIVPTLEIDGHVIGQSLAILDYLDARDREPRFVPRDPARRARVLQKTLAVAAEIHPVNNLRIRRYLAEPLCLVPQMFNARRVELDLAPYPELDRIDARLRAIDAFAAAHPERVAERAVC